jgi:hypothetical protein
LKAGKEVKWSDEKAQPAEVRLGDILLLRSDLAYAQHKQVIRAAAETPLE